MVQWIVEAYGQVFMANTSADLIRLVDRHGEKHGLRAVSIVPIKCSATMEGNRMTIQLPPELQR